MAVGADGLPENVRLSELDGLRVITEAMPSVRSVALGLWVRAGSRDERPDQAGLSHFLEHLLFKGTERHSAIEISELFDGMGAAANAATSKESTHLHARFLDAHTPAAFDLLSEMLLKSSLPSEEIEPERDVVLEEIAMYEDEPQDRVHDVLAEAVYGDHPLGRRVLGRAEVIAGIPRERIAEYHAERYTAPNLIVAAAGHVDHDEIASLARRHLSPASGEPAGIDGAGAKLDAQLVFREKETEQYHICFGAPGIARADERRFALGVLDTIFGGSTSSRLFREIREKRGLAYAVGSYTDPYIDRGMVAMYVGTREENVAECCEIIGTELRRLRDEGIGQDELHRAKEHAKGRMVLALESSGARMSRIARALMYEIPLLGIDEMLARVDAVAAADLDALIEELYDPGAFSAACIGADENRFREAAGSVGPALAAAA